MKKCAQCGSEYNQSSKNCPSCGYGPYEVNKHVKNEKEEEKFEKDVYGPKTLTVPPFVMVIIFVIGFAITAYLGYSFFVLSQISWPSADPNHDEIACKDECDGEYIFDYGNCTCVNN